MDRIKKFFSKKYGYYAAGVGILFIAGAFVFGSGSTSVETITAKRSDFVNQVSVSGKIEKESMADLSFAASGRIEKILVKENQKVRSGQVLAQLEISDLLADLKIKEVNSRQQDTEVESAYRKMLGADLELIAHSSTYTVDAPTISGIYAGAEGQYKIIIKKEGPTYTDYTLLTFRLENTKRVINETGPTPLGTQGLYISFSEDLEDYVDTVWYLNIPNKAGDSYLENYNAYSEAKAEFENQKVSSVVQGEIDKIRADIKKSTIYAPFAGVVTKVDKEVGEIAASNEPFISMIGDGTFQIESFVPEVSIDDVRVGQEALVTLDAYGENMGFGAKVISIDPAETMRDGVATYRVKLIFDRDYPSIRSGMTANVSIVVFNYPDVITIPGGALYYQDGRPYVKVKNKKDFVLREVEIRAWSNLGQVAISSGLEEGEEILLNPNAD